MQYDVYAADGEFWYGYSCFICIDGAGRRL
jgi:hypothetical protein